MPSGCLQPPLHPTHTKTAFYNVWHCSRQVSEAYGRMMLLDGLFQADGHPGNILVMKGGRGGRFFLYIEMSRGLTATAGAVNGSRRQPGVRFGAGGSKAAGRGACALAAHCRQG